MKKLLLLLAGIAMSFMTFAQSMDTYAETQQDKLRAYAGPGVGLSSGLVTRSFDIGLWNDKVWYAIVCENTPKADTSMVAQTYVGPKFYRKVKTYNKVDMFLYFATKIGISDNKPPLQFEPGTCFVWNITKHIGLQWSTSLPLYETKTSFGYVNPNILSPGLSTSFTANWFF